MYINDVVGITSCSLSSSMASDAALPSSASLQVAVRIIDHDFRHDLPGGIGRCTSI
jgi:hypothetical protein